MNEILNKFLQAGDKFMRKFHLKQPGFTYTTRGPFTRNKKRIEKFMQTGNTDFIHRNKLVKDCFQHYMTCGKSKVLAKRTQSDKILRDKAFKIANDPKYNGYLRGFASMDSMFVDKTSSGSGVAIEPNSQLANELQKQIIRNLKKRKVYSF